MKKKKLLIIGAGGHGKVLADIAMNMNKWTEICFLDDNKNLNFVMGLEVIGTLSEALNYINEYDFFVGIGNNVIRRKIYEELEQAGANITILIHPDAVIGYDVEIGAGTAVMAGVVINCCTRIGTGCIINTGATIDHDNYIDDFVHISPGVHLSGTVKVGAGTWLGTGSVVSNNVSITGNCIIGAGSLVIKDIEVSGKYYGVPARRI